MVFETSMARLQALIAPSKAPSTLRASASKKLKRLAAIVDAVAAVWCCSMWCVVRSVVEVGPL